MVVYCIQRILYNSCKVPPVMYQLLETLLRYFVHNTQFQKILMQSTQFHLFTAVNLVLDFWVFH
jgi:hypothetical protein